MGEKTFRVTYDLIPGTRRSSYCTFCGRSRMVFDYAAGRYVAQVCESCAKNLPGVVKAEVVEEKVETKKKKN